MSHDDGYLQLLCETLLLNRIRGMQLGLKTLRTGLWWLTR